MTAERRGFFSRAIDDVVADCASMPFTFRPCVTILPTRIETRLLRATGN